MKFAWVSAVLIVGGLSGVSSSALAADSYFFCTILANTGGQYSYKHIVQKNISKGDITKDQQLMNRILDQYVDFIKVKHPEWYQGYRANNNDQSFDLRIHSVTHCLGPYATTKTAELDRDDEIKERSEKYAKDSNNGPVIIDDEFVYKP